MERLDGHLDQSVTACEGDFVGSKANMPRPIGDDVQDNFTPFTKAMTRRTGHHSPTRADKHWEFALSRRSASAGRYQLGLPLTTFVDNSTLGL